MKIERIRALEKKFPPIRRINAVMESGLVIPISSLAVDALPSVVRLEAPPNADLNEFDHYLSLLKEAAFCESSR